MSNDNTDKGVILALLDRFNKQRLPRMLEIKGRVDRGEKLDERDFDFLQEVLKSASEVGHIVAKFPEYEPLVAQIIDLYKQISAKGLENEQKG